MITYKEATALFSNCKNKERGYKLANNTRLRQRGRAFAVRLHDTDIVVIRPDGKYRINSGGWRTVTTKERMNRVLPCFISQKSGIWYVGDVCYADGMLIQHDGKVVGAEPLINLPKIKSEIDRRVSRFIKLLVRMCSEHQCIGTWESYGERIIPRPSNKVYLKRLWTILKTTINPGDNMQPYLKLVHLAVLSRGYGDPEFIWRLVRGDCMNGREPHFLHDSLMSFVRQRKTFIAEMIARKELV